MSRPISGCALSSTERSRKRRERIARELAEAEARARAQAQAEREARQAVVNDVKATARIMLNFYKAPLPNTPATQEAWARLLAHLDRWQGW